MLETEGPREAQNVAETLLIYGSGAYLIVVAVALGLWLWCRYELPGGKASTERGRRLHAMAHARVRKHRNLLLLALVPLAAFLLLPGLPVVHPLATVGFLLLLLVIAGLVAQSTRRFVNNSG